MATNTSLRPRIRPDIDKQMTESLRPKSREEGLKEKRKREEDRDRQTKGFGDLEYRAELEPQLSWNPIARLGYDPDKHKIVNTQGVADLYGTAMFINRLGGGERSVRNLMRAGLSRKDAERVKEDDVVTSPNLSFSPVISHEFTHRGFKLLKEERDKDPEAFDKKYGKNAGRILEYTKHRYPGGVGESTEEYYVEMFDDLDTRFNTTSLKVDQDFEKFPKSTVRGTVQGSYAGPTFDLKDYSPKEDAKRFEQIRGFQDKILHLRGMDKGILGLMDAAQDILTEQGEPPKFKKQTKSFFEKIFNFSEGGLAGQTNAVFGTSSEDMSPQDYAQSYMEGLGITPMKDLGGLEGITFKDAATFVAEATPIIGDAIAAKEVYDELQKDDPNYLLVGALGGAAVIGLIPGLGDAAAAGIRKGAKSALDTVKRVEVDLNTLGSMGGNIKVGTGIPKINMIEGSPAGINNQTVTQSAVDLVNSPAFGEGFAEKLREVAAENSIAVGDKTFMPMDVYTELVDRVNNPEFKIIEPVKEKKAEGGIVMKDQMEMAFMQEGGLKDDGMDVDPVSGNDIPPGSMASEVRDDIPAQLSEGEYVVPADVVQYFGVKFFEDLRMDAKRGLADMESNGRIGGEPIDMPRDMPMDNTPTVAVSTGGYIDGIPAAEYNVGGMASNLYNNPTQMDQEVNNIISTMYNNPQVMDELSRRGIQLNRTQAPMNPQQMNQANPPAEARMGFNPGGLSSNQAAGYDYITSPTIPGPMYQTPGASYTFASPPQLTTTSAGAGSNMPSVEYCNSIDMDYDPSTKMCVPRASAQTPQQGGGGNDDPGPDMPKPEPWFNNVNWEDPTAQMDSFFGKEGKVGSAVAGMAGSMIGGPLLGGAATFGAQVSNLAQARAMVNVYRAMGMNETADNIDKQVKMAEGTIVKGNKALGMADQTINKIFGSDGDMLTISAMRDAGINVPRGLRDDELDDYLKDLTLDDRRLLRKRYAPNYKDPVAKGKKSDPQGTVKIGGEDIDIQGPIDITSKPDDGGDSLAEKIAKEYQREQANKNKKIDTSAATKGVATTGRTDASGKKAGDTGYKSALRQRQEDKKSTNYGGPGFRNKGGLMSKKKKKK